MSKLIIAFLLTIAVSGCSAASKTSKSATASNSNGFLNSSKQVQQDLTQTQTDFGKLESQVKLSK